MSQEVRTHDSIQEVDFSTEMKESYLRYSLSVVRSRAISDVRDGCKPVHRRILWAMYNLDCLHNKVYRKSARVTGDVSGKYHPHGSSYEALIRLSQYFSVLVELVDCQGNNGSIDGDNPAAERYTEVRLTKAGEATLKDIEEDVVDFVPNYDGSCQEPTVLPVPFPLYLINGNSGIAVGMVEHSPPHNPDEVMSAAIALLKNPDLTLSEIMEIIPAPDFPTGGVLTIGKPLLDAYRTGKGSVFLRGECTVSDSSIIITSIPYQVCKARLVEHIATLVQDKTIEGVSDLRDESDRDGLRVVIELKKSACGESIKQQLYTLTDLQVNVPIQMTAIHKGRPKQMGILEILKIFLDFREQITIRRTIFRLKKTDKRLHDLSGLLLALDAIDQIVSIIRGSSSPEEARKALCEMRWTPEQLERVNSLFTHHQLTGLTEAHAQNILNLRLQSLTRLERNKIVEEATDLLGKSNFLREILNNRAKRLKLIEEELGETAKLISQPRLTKIANFNPKPEEDACIAKEDMVVTLTATGYIKRMPLDTYQTQHRGGKGKQTLKFQEVLTNIFAAHTLQEVLFFGASGQVYSKKVYQLPIASPGTKGRTLLSLIPEDRVSAILPIPEDASKHLVFTTNHGNIRRNMLEAFKNLRADGKIAIKLTNGESLISVSVSDENDFVIIATKKGKLIRFPVKEIRTMQSRDSSGVKGIELDPDDLVISAHTLSEESNILTVSTHGYGKRTNSQLYRTSHRGGKGILNFDISAKTGEVASVVPVADHDILIVTDKGQTIRIRAQDIRETGRCAQGVQLLKTSDTVTQAIVIKESDV